MKNPLKALFLAAPFALLANAALANDIEGQIESINKEEQSFVVQGITFYANQSTDYDDGLKEFSDLQVGQKVEVDFDYRDGKHQVSEVELDN